jgi:peptidoglycan/LPS O-acetylase OafA/YrhL
MPGCRRSRDYWPEFALVQEPLPYTLRSSTFINSGKAQNMTVDWVETLNFERRNNFDFLRFLFAFIVVMAHTVTLSGNPDLAELSFLFDSEISVYGFFIISGFLITKSCLTSKNFNAYLAKRSKRLLPAYVFVVLMCALTFSLLSSYDLAEYFTSSGLLKYVISNLLFLNFLQPNLPGVFEHNNLQAINGALWTIKVEVSFYLILPILFHFLRRVKKLFTVNVILGVIYISAFIYRYVCDLGLQHSGIGIFKELGYQLPGVVNYFVVGMALLINYDFVRSNEKYLTTVALAIFIAHYFTKMDYLLAPSLGMIIFYTAYHCRRLNNWGKHGDISYGIYIFHFPLIQILVSFGLFAMYPFFMVFAAPAMVIIIGFLSWNLIEKRYLKERLA